MNQNLGKIAVDKVTGFKGTVTGYSEYITGCCQYLLRPKCEKDDKYPDGNWLDEDRLVFKDDVQKVSIEVKTPGSDIPAPIK